MENSCYFGHFLLWPILLLPVLLWCLVFCSTLAISMLANLIALITAIIILIVFVVMRPRRVVLHNQEKWGPQGGAPGPQGWEAENFALVFSSPAPIFAHFVSLAAGVSHNNPSQTCIFEGSSLQQPPKFHEKTPREGRKRAKMGAREECKKEKCWAVRRGRLLIRTHVTSAGLFALRPSQLKHKCHSG